MNSFFEIINQSTSKCIEEFPSVGQNMAIKFGKVGDIEIVKLGADWFDEEYKNGKHYGYMKMVNSFPNLEP